MGTQTLLKPNHALKIVVTVPEAVVVHAILRSTGPVVHFYCLTNRVVRLGQYSQIVIIRALGRTTSLRHGASVVSIVVTGRRPTIRPHRSTSHAHSHTHWARTGRAHTPTRSITRWRTTTATHAWWAAAASRAKASASTRWEPTSSSAGRTVEGWWPTRPVGSHSSIRILVSQRLAIRWDRVSVLVSWWTASAALPTWRHRRSFSVVSSWALYRAICSRALNRRRLGQRHSIIHTLLLQLKSSKFRTLAVR